MSEEKEKIVKEVVKDASKDLGLIILDEVEKMHELIHKTCETFCKEFDQTSVPLHILKTFQDTQIKVYRESFAKTNKKFIDI